jgi:dCMP deaminase
MIKGRAKGMDRPTWDNVYMTIAETVATRSTCLRRKVGAVLVKDKHLIATGYNGAPSGLLHCEKTGCVREALKVPSGERHELCRAVHAEQNIIIQAAIHGNDPRGADLYVTCTPCSICAKMLVNAGIKTVIYRGAYNDQVAVEILINGGVKLENYLDRQDGIGQG